MSLDIGAAFREGARRTLARNGLLLVGVFVAIALVTAVLFQTAVAEGLETLIAYQESLTPAEMGMNESEYEQSLEELRTTNEAVQRNLTLAVDLPIGAAVVGLLVLAFLSEAATIAAIRVFAGEERAGVSREATDGMFLATLNGFVGGIVSWGLILVASAFLLLPGIFLAVAFFFFRQIVALRDENFVQALADSWRLTRGHRLNVFALGLVLVLAIWGATLTVGYVVALLSATAADVLTAAIAGVTLGGGILGVFGTAVATRAFVQLTEADTTEEAEADDPYDAALGPDDIPQ